MLSFLSKSSTPVDINERLKRNNFDLLRVLFASAVCLVHTYQLSHFSELRFLDYLLSSDVAVKAFFVVSGFLIFMSFERSSSTQSYFKKRLRRIYPAYCTVIVICALLLVFVSANKNGYFFSEGWFKYLFANLTFLNFLQPSLPYVFDGNNTTAVNGALWTLKIEVLFYLSVPIFILFFKYFGRIQTLVVFYCLSLIYAFLCELLYKSTGAEIYVELGRQLPGQLTYFLSGALCYYYLDYFERKVKLLLAAAIIILIIGHFYSLTILEPFALATVVVFAALFCFVGNFGKYGDFSYGIYILHFPIIQLLLNSDWFVKHPWLFFCSILVLTFCASICMWHLIEKRFLLRSSHYIKSHKP